MSEQNGTETLLDVNYTVSILLFLTLRSIGHMKQIYMHESLIKICSMSCLK